MKRHQLKILPEHFAAVVSGEKKAEFRINDRDYAAGDLLCLSEYGWLKDCDGLEGSLLDGYVEGILTGGFCSS